MWEELAKYSVGKERDKAIETKWLARFPLMVQGYLPVIEYEDFVKQFTQPQTGNSRLNETEIEIEMLQIIQKYEEGREPK